MKPATGLICSARLLHRPLSGGVAVGRPGRRPASAHDLGNGSAGRPSPSRRRFRHRAAAALATSGNPRRTVGARRPSSGLRPEASGGRRTRRRWRSGPSPASRSRRRQGPAAEEEGIGGRQVHPPDGDQARSIRRPSRYTSRRSQCPDAGEHRHQRERLGQLVDAHVPAVGGRQVEEGADQTEAQAPGRRPRSWRRSSGRGSSASSCCGGPD